MSTFLSQRMLSLISTRGQVVTLTRVSSPSYNPETGSVTTSELDYSVKAYISSYNSEKVDNDIVRRGDRQVLFPVFDTSGTALPEPQEGDLITAAQDDTVKVIHTKKIYLGSSVVCYICQARE